MDRPSSLDAQASAVVADASVLINLNATGCADAILRALPNQCLVVDQVVQELRSGRPAGHRDADALAGLVERHVVKLARLGDAGMSIFANLVSGSAAGTVHDGEAATIACAVELSAVVLTDDRKAVRTCIELFPSLPIASTLDVLGQRHVQAALGRGLPGAIFNALDRARMRVPDRYGLWVVDLIGKERAAGCRSLPKRFRTGDQRPAE